MELTSFERDMLEGKYGEGMALAMKVQVGTGRAFYAKRMVPITRAHVAASAQQGDIYFVEKLVAGGARCVVPPTTNPSMDLDYVRRHLWEMKEHGISNVTRSNEAYRQIGAVMTLSCTPEIEANVPAFGEVIAFSESSATPYVNSVLGARSNRESSISALCAAVTGRVPEYGYLLGENRLAQVLVEVEATVETDADWRLLGYAYPQVYGGPEVPVFTGITERPTPEGFVGFGVELATSGSVAMYHVAGITPEAPDVDAALGGKEPKVRVKVTDADLDRVRQQFAGEPGPIDYALFGCPHLTVRQLGDIAGQIQGRRFAVDTWILVSKYTLELADRMGFLEVITRAGGHVIADTCMDVPGAWDIYYDRPAVTESQKCAFYCQVLGQRYAVRPLDLAVEAAIAGEVH
jgi:cis-L-3-hydroxyproline dehydratase